MADMRAIARGFLFVASIALTCGLGRSAKADDPGYVPDGPNFPTITLNEGPEGAPGLPPLKVPPPKGWDKQSTWNMQVVGFNDGQGRPSSDDGWVENQNGRYIVYMTSTGGNGNNPLTGRVENSGTSLIDATDPPHPVYLANVATKSDKGAPHVAVCGGNHFPNAEANGLLNRWFMIRHDGNDDWEIWETTDPAHPKLLTTILSNGVNSHHSWWECDTGIAYMIFNQKGDGWHTGNHIYIYDLSNPTSPKFIRQFGLPGQQPAADVATQKSCYNAPSDTCFEGVTNPPTGTHDIYSAGVNKNRVYIGYGSSTDGIFQILDRTKLLKGCDTSVNAAASANCGTKPTQADLLYPQISYLTANPHDGAHTFIPIFGVPIPETQTNFETGAPVKIDIAVGLSEQTANECAPQKWKNPSLMDISDERTPYPISTPTVGQFPGYFCAKGARFGTHEMPRRIYAPYYGKLLIVSYFNAGLQVFDIRDPYNPSRVAYFIQAPDKNTMTSCGSSPAKKTDCRKATFSDLGELDDRGYIYNMDRSGSGLTILKLTGDALKVIAPPASPAKAK
jgi:hypothetical protein